MRVCLGPLADLPDGDSRGVDAAGDGRASLFVIRRGARVVAWRDDCPHIAGARMAWRRDAYLNADRSRIVCHAHGAEFDIDSGLCLRGPCAGERLAAVPAWVDARGLVWLDAPED